MYIFINIYMMKKKFRLLLTNCPQTSSNQLKWSILKKDWYNTDKNRTYFWQNWSNFDIVCLAARYFL